MAKVAAWCLWWPEVPAVGVALGASPCWCEQREVTGVAGTWFLCVAAPPAEWFLSEQGRLRGCGGFISQEKLCLGQIPVGWLVAGHSSSSPGCPPA